MLEEKFFIKKKSSNQTDKKAIANL